MSGRKLVKAARLNPIPDKLKSLIKRLNLLPVWMGIEMPRFSVLIRNLTIEEKHCALYEALEELDMLAQQVLGESKGRRKVPEKDIDNLKLRLRNFKHYVLEDFALKANHDLQIRDRNFDELHYRLSLHTAISRYVSFFRMKTELRELLRQKGALDRISFSHQVNFLINEKGELQLQIDELLEALNGIEFNRLGECEICGRFFWVGRKGIVCCSHRCGNVRNNRTARERYKSDPIKYQLRKAIEEKKRKPKVHCAGIKWSESD